MAEMCLKHYNELRTGAGYEAISENDVIMEYDLCEMCGNIQMCVMCEKEDIKLKNRIKRFIQIHFR